MNASLVYQSAMAAALAAPIESAADWVKSSHGFARIDPAARRRLMQAVKTKDTGPERAVRSLLHRLGYRFRLHRRDLPGTPDIVLPGRRAAIFVHGCYWHGHGCRIGRLPKSRLDYWEAKIEANRQRDSRKADSLAALGWRVLVVWQCEIKDEAALAEKLGRFLGHG